MALIDTQPVKEARALVDSLNHDLEQARRQQRLAELAMKQAQEKYQEASYSLGFCQANVLRAEDALEALKPRHLCRISGCWNPPVPGGMGHCDGCKS